MKTKDKQDIEIQIDRDSVCAGDDGESHQIVRVITDEMTFTLLFKKMIREKYLPEIYGNDVVWVLSCDGDDIVAWTTKENKFFTRFIHGNEPAINHRGEFKSYAGKNIRFKYYSPPINRARYIFNTFKGNHFHIWHEGFFDEYKYYNISETTEREWAKELEK